MSPRHTRYDENAARAPYNFVTLNAQVLTVPAETLPDQDVYHAERKTGHFDVTLTTVSPLYIRGMLNETEAAQREQHKNKPDFFRVGDDEEKPVIPGSSLRGMIRSIVEVISLSRMSRVSESRLFYRDLRGKHYQSRIVKPLGEIRKTGYSAAQGYQAKVRGGFLRQEGDQWFIDECTIARVDTAEVLRMFGLRRADELYQLDGRALTSDNRRNPNQTPNWAYQHHPVCVDVDAEDDHFFQEQRNAQGKLIHPDFYLRFCKGRNLSLPSHLPKTQGTLVLTGRMERKHLEFVFVPRKGSTSYLIPNDPQEDNINKRLLDQFQSDFQLTDWQLNAFPDGHGRQMPGYLKNGEPVFFLVQEDKPDQVLFFGRAQMFRLPYQRSPKDLIASQQSSGSDVDLTDAIFGFVSLNNNGYAQGDKGAAYAGRIFFRDADYLGNEQGIYDTDAPIIPPILSTPKPTTFQHYLEQPKNVDQKNLHHYDTTGAKVRGRKVYWRARLDSTTAIHQADVNLADSSQHTQLRAVKPRVTFRFRVDFENLSEVELGALAWALTLPGVEAGHHMLGMGKPFGMGIVKLGATLCVNNRTVRYHQVFAGDQWADGDDNEDVQPYIDQFTAEVQRHTGKVFTEVDSIRDLTAILKLRQRRPDFDRDLQRPLEPLFDYQVIDSDHEINDYYGRPVLPRIAVVAEADDERGRKERAAQYQLESERAAQARIAAGYQVGDLVRGKLDYVDAGVYFILNDPLPGEWLPIIRMRDLGTAKYTEQGQSVSAIILETELDGDGTTTILYCRPATKDERRRRE